MASIFQKMNENSRLKRGLKTATKGDPDARYNGPDGELFVNLRRHGAISKDGRDMAVLEFVVCPSEEHSGENISKIYVFADNAAFTAEQTMGRFFGDLQMLGIRTEGREDDMSGIEKDVNNKIASKVTYKLSITGAQGKYPKVTILEEVKGTSTAPKEDAEEDEWEEETSEETLVGGICTYNGDTCVVDSHKNGMLVLVDSKDPNTIWYEDIPENDVVFKEE